MSELVSRAFHFSILSPNPPNFLLFFSYHDIQISSGVKTDDGYDLRVAPGLNNGGQLTNCVCSEG